jgi:hypothetical protein
MGMEEFIKKFERLEKPNIENEIEFINGKGYIQQDFELVEELKKDLCELFDNKYNFQILGRVLDDNNNKLYKNWTRLMCIDKEGKEWGQPYYSRNGSFAETECINIKQKEIFLRRWKLKKINKKDERF